MLYSLFLFTLFVSAIQAKVSIFAHYFGQPEFIKYQCLFFKKNLLDDHELVVFDDSNSMSTSEQIKNECNKYGVKYIRIPRSVFELPILPVMDSYVGPSSPSFECCLAVQYIYDNYVVPSNDICLLLDNDIFLLSEFSIEKYLGSSAFAYVKESNGPVNYMLPNFIILNPCKMPEKENLNFNMGKIGGEPTDSGGFTYFYLQKHKELAKTMFRHSFYDNSSPLKTQFINTCHTLFTMTEWKTHYFIDNCFSNKETFLHLRMGSNWSAHSAYQIIINEMTFLFDQLLIK